MNEEQFILLAIKVLSGHHLPDELEDLRKQMTAHEPYRIIFEKLSIYWKADTHLEINEESALDKVWSRIRQTPAATAGDFTISGASLTSGVTPSLDTAGNFGGLTTPDASATPCSLTNPGLITSEPPVRRLRWQRILAAAVLIPFIVITTWYLLYPSRKPELVEKYNQKGIRSIIILPDGSKIWLNADSRLKYPAVFQASLREVYLEGEAFFEIAKNPQRPFVVHLPKGDVNVLGTSFDIRAYEDEQWMTTSVATGRVAFVPLGTTQASGSDTAASFELTPNRKALYDFQTRAVQVAATDAEADRGWINGIMTFNNEPLWRIATELERAFGKPIRFKDVPISQYRYTATFKNNTEEEILSILKKVKPFHFTVTDKFIEINK